MNHKNYSHGLQVSLAYSVGKAKLCNYTVNTAKELPFSISRKVYTAIKSVTNGLYLRIPF